MDKFFAYIKKYTSKINKYWFTVIVFVIVTFFISDNSTLMDRISYNRQINQLEKDIDYYTKEKQGNLDKLKALESDDETLERFAREEYHMAKANEELFLIVD